MDYTKQHQSFLSLIIRPDGHVLKNPRLSPQRLLYKHIWECSTIGKPKTALLLVGNYSIKVSLYNDIYVTCASWH